MQFWPKTTHPEKSLQWAMSPYWWAQFRAVWMNGIQLEHSMLYFDYIIYLVLFFPWRCAFYRTARRYIHVSPNADINQYSICPEIKPLDDAVEKRLRFCTFEKSFVYIYVAVENWSLDRSHIISKHSISSSIATEGLPQHINIWWWNLQNGSLSSSEMVWMKSVERLSVSKSPDHSW